MIGMGHLFHLEDNPSLSVAKLSSACRRVLGRIRSVPVDSTMPRSRYSGTRGSHHNPSRAHSLRPEVWAKVAWDSVEWVKAVSAFANSPGHKTILELTQGG